MSEKMLMTQALDERDLLVKKINDKISKIKLVDVKKRNEEKTAGERVAPEEFGDAARSGYQQIMDLIGRYQRLDAAIVASNAATWIETSYGKYTIAGAIALRHRLRQKGLYTQKNLRDDFEARFAEQFENQHCSAVNTAREKNRAIESQAETMRLSILGRDNKTKDDKPLEVVDAYIRENTTELVDPLDAEKKAQELRERTDKLLSELDTQIKVSNATTMIEF